MPYVVRTPKAVAETAVLTDVNARNAAYEQALNAINGRGIREETVDAGLQNNKVVTSLTFWHSDPGALATNTLYAATNLRVFTGVPTATTSRYLSVSFNASAFTTAGTATIFVQLSTPSQSFVINLVDLGSSTNITMDQVGQYVAGETITGKLELQFSSVDAQLIRVRAQHSAALTLTNACLQLFVQSPMYP